MSEQSEQVPIVVAGLNLWSLSGSGRLTHAELRAVATSFQRLVLGDATTSFEVQASRLPLERLGVARCLVATIALLHVLKRPLSRDVTRIVARLVWQRREDDVWWMGTEQPAPPPAAVQPGSMRESRLWLRTSGVLARFRDLMPHWGGRLESQSQSVQFLRGGYYRAADTEEFEHCFTGHARLQHPNLVQIVCAFDSVASRPGFRPSVGYEVDPVGLANVLEMWERGVHMAEEEMAYVLYHVLQALRYLHANTILLGSMSSDDVTLAVDGTLRLRPRNFSASFPSFKLQDSGSVGSPFSTAPGQRCVKNQWHHSLCATRVATTFSSRMHALCT
jgi:hypothetical protein